MEKVEVSRREVKLPGKRNKTVLALYEWRFTETEKREIRRALRLSLKKEIAKEKIDHFIRHLEFFVQGKKSLLEQPPKADTRGTRERVLNDCKAALRHLELIGRGKKITWHSDTLDHYGAGTVDPVSDYIWQAYQSARQAVGPLQYFIKVVENYHLAENKKAGRKKADTDHFIKKLKDIYIEHIGKPTLTETGAFFTIVKWTLENLGLPCEDPSRAIKAALKK